MPRILIMMILFCSACDNSGNENRQISGSDSHARIITLAPHLAELTASAGALEQLVGVVEYSKFPQQVQSLPKVGDAFLVDFESIINLQPDHVLTWKGGTSASVLRRLKQSDTPYIEIEITKLHDIPRAVLQIAELTQTRQQALQNISEFNTQLERLQNIPVNKQTAFIQLSDAPLFTVSGSHWMSEAIALCGLENIFTDLPRDSVPVSPESVLTAQPQVIIRLQPPGQEWQQLDHLLQNSKVIDVNPDFLSIPSLRIMEGIKQICSQLQS